MFEPKTMDPLELFADWYEEAKKNELNDPNAMSLATVDKNGIPSVRIVLLKGFDVDGFVFYTNLQSRKANEFMNNPNVAVCFHWKSLQRQVRIEGQVSKVSDKEADEYFKSRARLSRLGAWASKQSEILESRDHLLARLKTFEEKYDGETIPRPSHWSGNRIAAKKIEFWEDGEFRLHDRFIFERQSIDGTWIKARLYP
jgi:pyridoxamine 5'-phosphate oxidase